MVRYVRRSLLISLVFAGLMGKAWADPTAVAVLGVEPIDVPADLSQQLTDALRQRAAGTAGIRSVQAKDLIEIKMVFGCDSEQPACLAQAGKTLGADKLLYGTIKKGGRSAPNNVAVSLKLLDVKTGTIERSVNETVAKRELAAGSVNATAAKWFAELVPVEAKPILTVTSDPANAAVSVDGQSSGRTPVTLRDLAPGSHTVTISLSGRIPQSRTVELRAGGTSEVSATLEAEHPAVVTPTPPPPPEQPAVVPPRVTAQAAAQPSGHPGRTAKFVALGALVGAVVAGSVAIYTWRTYDSLQTTTHNDLDALLPNSADRCPMMGAPMTPAQQFACNPGPTPPPGVGSSPDAINKYKNDFSSGQTYANATTALWVVTGALAATSIVSYIIGDRQAAKAEREKKSAGRVLQQSLRLAPVFSKNSGALSASFEF
jgi:hypothetical protein